MAVLIIFYSNYNLFLISKTLLENLWDLYLHLVEKKQNKTHKNADSIPFSFVSNCNKMNGIKGSCL